MSTLTLTEEQVQRVAALLSLVSTTRSDDEEDH